MTSEQTIIPAMIAMTIINCSGTLALKTYAGSDKTSLFLIGTGCYCVGAALYVHLLRHESLAVLSVVTTLFQMGMLMSLSVWLYGDQVSTIQWTGLGIGFFGLAIAMIAAVI